MEQKILLKNGTLLLHDEKNIVTPIKADLLIQGTEIASIEPVIEPTASMQVIDCTGSIISPGFISTHHHLWQTQLKAVHANHTLLEYFYAGMFLPKDISSR